METRDIIAAVRTRWWLPALGLLLGAMAAVLVTVVSTPQYTSTIQFFVSTTGSTSASEVLQGGQFSEQRVASYAELLQGEKLASRVVDRLHLDRTPAELSRQLTVTALPETVLIDVAVTDPSPRQAQRIAAAIGEEFTRFVSSLEQSDDGGARVEVTVTDDPLVAETPSSPQPLRIAALGLLAGLALGSVLAVVRARFDRSVRNAEQASALAGAPVIGVVLRDDALENRHVVDRAAGNPAAEDYRQLGTNLQFLNVDQPPRVIMVSSAVPAEGKSTAAVNLALTLADGGRRVCLVEADLRRPAAVRYLGLVEGIGVTNILTGTADVADVAQPVDEGDLSVIGSGPIPPNPGELLASGHMRTLLEKLRVDNDYVIVDAPPLLPVADATGLAAMVDGVLLSVRYGCTSEDLLRETAATLHRVGATTLGVILNMVSPRAGVAAARGRGHRYSYGDPVPTAA